MWGLWFFVSFRIFFSDNTRVRIFIFCRAKREIFFPEFNIRLYNKNSESDYFFFPPPKSEYFFQQHWKSEYFFRKKPYLPPPLQVKWSFPYINVYRKTSNIKIYHYIFDYKQTTFTYVDNICQINVYQKIKSAAIMNIH